MASAANSQTISSASAVTIFDATTDGGNAKKFFVGCRSSSAAPVLINVVGAHKTGEYVGIPAGASLEVEAVQPVLDGVTEVTGGFISAVTAQGDGGDALIDYGVTSKEVIAS